jgi:hypothetical protein
MEYTYFTNIFFVLVYPSLVFTVIYCRNELLLAELINNINVIFYIASSSKLNSNINVTTMKLIKTLKHGDGFLLYIIFRSKNFKFKANIIMCMEWYKKDCTNAFFFCFNPLNPSGKCIYHLL